MRDNVIVQPSLTTGKGVYCSIQAHLKDNVIRNFTQNWSSCHDAGGNVAF